MPPAWLSSLLGRRDPRENIAAALYRAAVEQARSPAFYDSCGVPDTVDGRFDAIAIHVWLLLSHLKGRGEAADAQAQALYDLFFADMDRSLREMGAGDLGVGKRVKVMAQAFMGRIKAYDAALASADPGVLEAALRRNLYRDAPETDTAALRSVAAYVRREAARLRDLPVDQALGGIASFGPPTECRPIDRRAP